MTDALVAAIEADPDDEAACAVYADWLIERGDPLGELIALSIAAGAEHDPRLEAMTRAYEAEWFGPFAAEAAWWSPWWHHGVLRTLEVTHYLGAELIVALAKAPAARFLRELLLSVEAKAGSRGKREATSDTVAAIVEHGLPPMLRRLELQLERYSSARGQDVNLTDIWPRLAHVEALTLGVAHVLGEMNMPRLRRLRLSNAVLDDWSELERADLPCLETLELGVDWWHHLERIRLRNAPCWRHLTLDHAPPEPFGETGEERNQRLRITFEQLGRAPSLEGLSSLDMMTSVTRSNVAGFVEVAPSLVHLNAVRVSADSLDPASHRELTRILGRSLVAE